MQFIEKIRHHHDNPDNTLLELLRDCSIDPKRASASSGGIYHSPCPGCGGKDRLTIWLGSNRYWCRQCDKKGDAIQFCRDFMGLTFKEACDKLGQVPAISPRKYSAPIFHPRPSELPSNLWIDRASAFISQSHANALNTPEAIRLLKERGFTLETIRIFQLGWNPQDRFEDSSSWGIPQEEKKRIWLPKGLVIPTFFEDRPVKIKVRRSAYCSTDRVPKYIEIPGSRKSPSIYGASKECMVILESELDGMLLQQCATDLCSSLALGGVKKKPDLFAHKELLLCKRLLFSLDFDQPGMSALKFWKTLYPHIQVWPVPEGKSPGDALKLGVDLHEWIYQSQPRGLHE